MKDKPLKTTLVLSVVAGTLLMMSGVPGSVGFLGKVIEFISERMGGLVAETLSIVLWVFSFLASFGGILVIVGGILIYRNRLTIGKLLISIGSGSGFIGLLFMMASALLHGWFYMVSLILTMVQSLGWIGIFLSIAARMTAKKPKQISRVPGRKRKFKPHRKRARK